MDPNYALGVSMNELKKAHHREQLNKQRRKKEEEKESGDIGYEVFAPKLYDKI